MRRKTAASGNDPTENWYRFGGREMGYVGNNGTLNIDAASATAKRTQTGEAVLNEGTTLRLPAGVTRNTNNARVFKPYDPGAAIGDTAPTAPVFNISLFRKLHSRTK